MSWLDQYRTDPEKGIVFGIRGAPLVKKIDGYVWISRDDGKHYAAHRLIWERVHGPIPAGLQINHINGCKHDNRIENLEVVTRSENALHAFRIGLCSAKGENNGRAIGKRRRIEGKPA